MVFCDEINLPDMDQYGTQRVISFLRQMVEHGGFYRTSDQTWIKLERIQVLTLMVLLAFARISLFKPFRFYSSKFCHVIASVKQFIQNLPPIIYITVNYYSFMHEWH